MISRAIPLLLFCLISTGCTFSRPGTASIPIAFPGPPALPEIIEAINANSSRVQQLHSDNVRLSTRMIGLNATLDFEKTADPSGPGRFRLSGKAFGSRQLDLGSNDREYWMWVKQNQPPTVFYGRHNEFHRSAARQILPMPPSWIIEALGIVHIDPQAPHEIYQSQHGTDSLLQIRSLIPTPHGQLTRVLEVDWNRALIVQHQIYDANRQLLAVADATDFTYDTLNGVALPRSVKVKLPPAGLNFDFEVDSYTINEPITNPMTLWSMPEIPGHQYRNLADPRDMQGINLMGTGTDFYDSGSMVGAPIAPTTKRTAWLRVPSLTMFR